MTSDDAIFAGLDEIRWAEVEHLRGPAVDLPGYLRKLRSASPHERDEAVAELCDRVCHLGTRLPATHLTVPFLIRVVVAPDTVDRDQLVEFLIRIAIGDDADYFPGGFDAQTERERMQEAELLAYDAVRAGLPELRGLLHDADPDVRAATAYLLAWFPEDAVPSVIELVALLGRESDRRVIIDALIALGLLPGAPTSVMSAYLNSCEEPIAWAAAAGLVAAKAADATVIARLGAALRSESADLHGLRCRFGEFSDCASTCLGAVPGDLVPPALDTVLAAFTPDSLTRMWAAASAAVALAFPDPPAASPSAASPPTAHPPTFAALDDRRQRVLRALVAAGPKAWERSNQLELLLSPHKIPGWYDTLCTYVGYAG